MKKPAHRVQYAALPYRQSRGGAPQIMLVTSIRSKRWIIPKGWPMKRKRPHAAAAREALEEAGVVGRVGKKPLGTYSYRKRLKGGGSVVCEVKVFPLKVSGQRKRWREAGKREVKWFSPARAARLVGEPLLRAMIRTVPERLTKRTAGAARKKGARSTENGSSRRRLSDVRRSSGASRGRAATPSRSRARRAVAAGAKSHRIRSKPR